jgi:hypothetical protein
VYNLLNVNKEDRGYFGLLEIGIAFDNLFDLQTFYLTIARNLHSSKLGF